MILMDGINKGILLFAKGTFAICVFAKGVLNENEDNHVQRQPNYTIERV